MYMTIRRLLFALSKYDTIAPSLMDKLRTEQCHVSGYYVLSMSSNCKVLVLVICPWNGINNHVAGLTVVLSSYLVLQQTCSPTTTTGKNVKFNQCNACFYIDNDCLQQYHRFSLSRRTQNDSIKYW